MTLRDQILYAILSSLKALKERWRFILFVWFMTFILTLVPSLTLLPSIYEMSSQSRELAQILNSGRFPMRFWIDFKTLNSGVVKGYLASVKALIFIYILFSLLTTTYYYLSLLKKLEINSFISVFKRFFFISVLKLSLFYLLGRADTSLVNYIERFIKDERVFFGVGLSIDLLFLLLFLIILLIGDWFKPIITVYQKESLINITKLTFKYLMYGKKNISFLFSCYIFGFLLLYLILIPAHYLFFIKFFFIQIIFILRIVLKFFYEGTLFYTQSILKEIYFE